MKNEPGDECHAGLSKAPVEGHGGARRRGGQPDVAARLWVQPPILGADRLIPAFPCPSRPSKG